MTVSKNDVLLSGPEQGPLLVLAHGAGAGMSHPFMQSIAERLAAQQIGVLRFNFPYMQLIEQTGKRRPPNPMPVLMEHFQQVINGIEHRPLFIGGKSMGGRVASLIGQECNQVHGLVLLGFPFHPVGKPEKYRGEHLETMQIPTLLLQGERDTFGNREELASFNLSKNITTHWLKDGDHSFKPRKASGLTLEDNLDSAAENIAAFIRNHASQ